MIKCYLDVCLAFTRDSASVRSLLTYSCVVCCSKEGRDGSRCGSECAVRWSWVCTSVLHNVEWTPRLLASVGITFLHFAIAVYV